MSGPHPIPPELAERFESRGVLGEGSFGVVLRAVDRRDGEEVALKLLTLPPDDEEGAARFAREAKVTAGLEHPNIVGVRAAGVTGSGQGYLAYELVEGEDLAARVERGRAREEEVIRWGRALAGALRRAHESGVIHRDVKPANVLLRGDGTPVLCDFGLARLTGGATFETATGRILGSPAYMAPELFRGERATPATDQFALAATLHELLTGHGPYPGESLDEVLRAAGGTGPLVAGGGGVRGVLARALARDPAARWPDMEAFGRALEEEPTPDPRASGATVMMDADPARVAETRPLEGATSRMAPAVVSPPASSPGRWRWAVGPALLLLFGLVYLLLPSGPPPVTDVQFRSLGDVLAVSWRHGGEVWLEVDGARVSAEASTPSTGVRALSWRGLDPEREVEARLAWPGGSGEAGRFLAGSPPFREAPRLTINRQYKVAMSRSAWVHMPGRKWERFGGGHQTNPPPGIGPVWRIHWAEGGLVGGLDYPVEPMLRRCRTLAMNSWQGVPGLVPKLADLHQALRGTQDKKEKQAHRRRIRQLEHQELGHVGSEGITWAPEILAVLSPDEALAFFNRLQDGWQMQSFADMYGGSSYGGYRLTGLAGTRSYGHGQLEDFEGPVVPSLSPEPAEVRPNDNGYSLTHPLPDGVPANQDAALELRFRWPSQGVIPASATRVALTLEVSRFPLDSRIDLESEARVGPLRVSWYPTRHAAVRKPHRKFPTVVIPRKIAPAPGTVCTLKVAPFTESLPRLVRVRSLEIRWADRAPEMGPSPADSTGPAPPPPAPAPAGGAGRG